MGTVFVKRAARPGSEPQRHSLCACSPLAARLEGDAPLRQLHVLVRAGVAPRVRDCGLERRAHDQQTG
eukprot:6183767-Pleurochrysis_carterae.AAC.5